MRQTIQVRTMRTLKELSDEVLSVQDACNLSGIVGAFGRAMHDLWEHARRQNEGTDWVNRHAITRAWVSKLVSLSRYRETDNTFETVMELAG
jgi:allantoicase